MSRSKFRSILNIMKFPIIGKLLSKVLRPIKTFNIENRAHRVIGKDPKPAPKYSSNLDDLKRAQEVNPDFLEKHYTKDIDLDNRLKDVFVSSKDPWNPDPPQLPSRYNKQRPLPQDRNVVPFYPFGQKEPEHVPPGKIVLREALQLIHDNQTEPAVHTAQSLASKYNLKLEDVEDIIKYNKTFQLYVPEPEPGTKGKRLSYASDLPKLQPEPETTNPVKEKIKEFWRRQSEF